jgi:thiamine pyrophosphokinase
VKGKGKAEDGGDEGIEAEEGEWLPDLILGDLDSLREDVKAFYEAKVRTSSSFALSLGSY